MSEPRPAASTVSAGASARTLAIVLASVAIGACRRHEAPTIVADRVGDAGPDAIDLAQAELHRHGQRTVLGFGRAKWDGLGWVEIVLSDQPVSCSAERAPDGATWAILRLPAGPGGRRFDGMRVGVKLEARVGGRYDPDLVLSGHDGGVRIASVDVIDAARPLGVAKLRGELLWREGDDRARGQFAATLCNAPGAAERAWEKVPDIVSAGPVSGTFRGALFSAVGAIARVRSLAGETAHIEQLELVPFAIASCADDALLSPLTPRLIVQTLGDAALAGLATDGPRPAVAVMLNGPGLSPPSAAGFLAEGLGPTQTAWIRWETATARLGDRVLGALFARGGDGVPALFSGYFSALACPMRAPSPR